MMVLSVRGRVVALGLFALQLCFSPRAVAANRDLKGPSESLTAAENAYEQVDFSATQKAACGGLDLGHATVKEGVRLHVLCAIASAALEKGEEARMHFKVALAMRPDLHLERELSPKLRSPYLEAQGYWSHYDDRLSVKAKHRLESRQLKVQVTDPAHFGYKLKVFVRGREQSAFRMLEKDASSTGVVELSREQAETGFAYYVTLVDAEDNALVEVGNESEPVEVAGIASPVARSPIPDRKAPVREGSVETRPSLWLPVTMLGLGVASLGAGLFFNVRRENAAHEWNGAECEKAGFTRLEQCSNVNSERVHAERAAIGFYAVGGAFLATGIGVWALRSPNQRAMQSAKRTSAIVECAAGLLSPSVICAGTF